jgi:hypothetical protein
MGVIPYPSVRGFCLWLLHLPITGLKVTAPEATTLLRGLQSGVSGLSEGPFTTFAYGFCISPYRVSRSPLSRSLLNPSLLQIPCAHLKAGSPTIPHHPWSASDRFTRVVIGPSTTHWLIDGVSQKDYRLLHYLAFARGREITDRVRRSSHEGEQDQVSCVGKTDPVAETPTARQQATLHRSFQNYQDHTLCTVQPRVTNSTVHVFGYVPPQQFAKTMPTAI